MSGFIKYLIKTDDIEYLPEITKGCNFLSKVVVFGCLEGDVISVRNIFMGRQEIAVMKFHEKVSEGCRGLRHSLQRDLKVE